MEKIVKPIKVTKVNFAPYGDLISSDGVEPMNINSGYAKRFAYPVFISNGLISSVDIKSPYAPKFDLFIFIGLTIFSIILLFRKP